MSLLVTLLSCFTHSNLSGPNGLAGRTALTVHKRLVLRSSCQFGGRLLAMMSCHGGGRLLIKLGSCSTHGTACSVTQVCCTHCAMANMQCEDSRLVCEMVPNMLCLTVVSILQVHSKSEQPLYDVRQLAGIGVGKGALQIFKILCRIKHYIMLSCGSMCMSLCMQHAHAVQTVLVTCWNAVSQDVEATSLSDCRSCSWYLRICIHQGRLVKHH